MQIRISLVRRFSKSLLLYSVCVVALVTTYVVQIEEANYYSGMQPWKMSLLCWVVLVAGLLFVALISFQLRGLPSEFFLVFYSSIVVMSFISLNSSSGTIDGIRLIFAFLLIVSPAIAVWVAGKIKIHIKLKGVLNIRTVEGIVFGIALLVSAFGALNPPPSAGMDFISSYSRRLEGRDLYGERSLISYALAMTMNGLIPYLSYKAGVSGRKWLLIAASGFALFFYWLVGVKSPLLYVFLAYFLGSLVAKNRHRSIGIYFLSAIILLFIMNLLEWLLYDYSIISDIFFRRVFAVQAQIQGYFVDFILGWEKSPWSFLTGSPSSAFKPTFYIGEYYFGNVDTNANTNAFLYALSLNGIFGYFFALLFVVIALTVLDALYRDSKNPAYLFLGFIYGLLLVEQAFSTAIASSGVGFIFLLTLLEKHEKQIVRH